MDANKCALIHMVHINVAVIQDIPNMVIHVKVRMLWLN